MHPILVKDMGDALIPFTSLEYGLNMAACILTLAVVLFDLALIIAILSNRRNQNLDNDMIFILNICLADLIAVVAVAVIASINAVASGWSVGRIVSELTLAH
jgi:predicted ATP-dependent serine protease